MFCWKIAAYPERQTKCILNINIWIMDFLPRCFHLPHCGMSILKQGRLILFIIYSLVIYMFRFNREATISCFCLPTVTIWVLVTVSFLSFTQEFFFLLWWSILTTSQPYYCKVQVFSMSISFMLFKLKLWSLQLNGTGIKQVLIY